MDKKELYSVVKSLQDLCTASCQTIWSNPEVGGEEEKSANYFREILAEQGFKVVNEPKMPHAFYAEYGSGHPVIAVVGEYDALPNLSQKSAPFKSAVSSGAPGHGCGHNLLGSASLTAAIAVKRYLEEAGIEGTVRFYGCPEEELLCGKVKMAYYGMFDGCDFALTWHPMSANIVYDGAYLASASARINFKGVSSHAGFAPERGRSALDAVELTSVGANYLREHIPDRSRIHYTTDSGGFAPNIVPDKASAWYFSRALNIDTVKDIMRRLELVAKGAAMMTETKAKFKLEYGCCEMAPNHKFADLAYQNLLEAEQPEYEYSELAFAAKLQEGLDPATLSREQQALEQSDNPIYKGVAPREQWESTPLNASSDSGDLSYMMPTALFSTSCWPIGVAPHTWQATACTGSSIGEKGAMIAAQVIAGMAYDLYNKADVRAEIKEEFQNTIKAAYVPMYQG